LNRLSVNYCNYPIFDVAQKVDFVQTSSKAIEDQRCRAMRDAMEEGIHQAISPIMDALIDSEDRVVSEVVKLQQQQQQTRQPRTEQQDTSRYTYLPPFVAEPAQSQTFSEAYTLVFVDTEGDGEYNEPGK
jgi:hypothetical protein